MRIDEAVEANESRRRIRSLLFSSFSTASAGTGLIARLGVTETRYANPDLYQQRCEGQAIILDIDS